MYFFQILFSFKITQSVETLYSVGLKCREGPTSYLGTVDMAVPAFQLEDSVNLDSVLGTSAFFPAPSTSIPLVCPSNTLSCIFCHAALLSLSCPGSSPLLTPASPPKCQALHCHPWPQTLEGRDLNHSQTLLDPGCLGASAVAAFE